MHAPSIEGPWTEYPSNPVISLEWNPHYNVLHVGTPDATWNEEREKLFVFFHGDNGVAWAETSDGVHFEYGGMAVTNEMGGETVTESSYARVFTHPEEDSEYKYGMFYMGYEADNLSRIRLAESVDGQDWVVDPDYVIEPTEKEGRYYVSGGTLWEWDGQVYVLYHATSGKSYARTIDKTLRHVGDDLFLLYESSGEGNDTGRIASPEVVTTDDGQTYLFYDGGPRIGATIGWAKVKA